MDYDFIGYSRKKSDTEKALKIIFDIFFKNKSLSFKKEVLEKINIKKNKIIIIKKDNKVISCLVTYKKKLLKNKDLSFCGLGFICVIKKYRGLNISKILIESAINILKKEKIDVVYLFARKKMDYFYLKFGFVGISTYSIIILNKPIKSNYTKEIKTREKFTLISPNIEDISFLNTLYKINYSKMNGAFERLKTEWKNLILSKYQNLLIKLILYNKEKIGYIIYIDDKILEISLNNYYKSDQFIHFLFDNLRFKKLFLEIYLSHKLIKNLKIYDITHQNRNCYFGGQLIKIINDKLQININNNLGQTKKILDAKTLSDISYNKSKQFCFLSTQEI